MEAPPAERVPSRLPAVSSAWRNSEVVVAVADTGPGVAPEEIPGLFEKYQRAAASQHRKGSGLGLFIVKALVEAHRGDITVRNVRVTRR